jgi:hypothetical protein
MGAIQNLADGLLPTGSFDITMLETGTSFIADSFSFDENTTKIQSKSARGRVNRQKVIATDITGSADFQLADSTTLAPRPRETFAVDADLDGNVEPYMIEKPGRKFTADGEYKCSVSIMGMANPLLYDSVTLIAPVVPSLTHAVAMTATNALAAFLPRDVTLGASPWSASGLPAGVTMVAATGVISGTPTTAGSYNVTIKCTGSITVDGVVETRIGARKQVWVVA